MRYVKKRNSVTEGVTKAIALVASIIIVIGVISFATDIFNANSKVDFLDTSNLTLDKTNGETYLIGTIMNRGSSGVTDLEISVAVDTDVGTEGIQNFEPTISTTDIDSGKSIVVNVRIEDISSDAIVLVQGTEIRVTFSGNSTSGPFITPATLTIK